MAKVLFGFNVGLRMTSKSHYFVDLSQVVGIYQALASGTLGDEKAVKENIRNIVRSNSYLRGMQNNLCMIFEQKRVRGAWHNLFNAVNSFGDEEKEVKEDEEMFLQKPVYPRRRKRK